MDLSTLDAVSYEELDGLALEKRVILRLVQEGMAVTSAAERPEILVSLRRRGRTLRLEVRGARCLETRDVSRVGTLAELHLEVAQKVAELAKACAAAEAPAAASAPTTQPALTRAASAPATGGPGPTGKVMGAGERRTALLEAQLGCDALVRGGGTDPLPRLALRLALGRAFGAHLAFGVAPSSGSGIDVTEWQLQGGLGYRLRAASFVAFEAAVLLGFVLHEFAVSNAAAASRSGSRADVLASLPLTVAFFVHRHVALGLRVAPAVAGESRQHLQGSEVVWRRSAWRLEAGGFLLLAR